VTILRPQSPAEIKDGFARSAKSVLSCRRHLTRNLEYEGAPAATADSIFPSLLTRIAEGVPVAPNARPAVKWGSSRIVDFSCIALLASTVPVEMITSSNPPDWDSQTFRSGSICWQKEQFGFQKIITVS
jgi:hypothetical protein